MNVAELNMFASAKPSSNLGQWCYSITTEEAIKSVEKRLTHQIQNISFNLSLSLAR